LFDTLDARLQFRGGPHTQEFRIYPLGTEGNGEIPGIERVIASRRDAQMPRAQTSVFPPQPPIERGPDGKGPYRVTQMTDEGYTVEIFLPRSIFKSPVFAPGWYIGFDAYVGVGNQSQGFSGNGWIHYHYTAYLAKYPPNAPQSWGDLLMLGTDARLAVQDAGPGWPRTQAIIPGHSYLVTVADPDRNVNLAAADTVLVSAEVADAGPSRGTHGRAGDAEVYVLKETGPNTSVFRGYVNTQPGSGSAVQGMLELMPGQEVRFGYVDFADSKGRRNVVYEQRVPVASGVLAAAPKQVAR
jgi:hypothetical protein